MKSISTFVIAFLIIGFFFLGLPEKGYSGAVPLPGPGCCQLFAPEVCFDIEGEGDAIQCLQTEGAIPVEDEDCIEVTGFCSGFQDISPIPTLSEWGLVAMAGVLGIVGYLVIRRRKVAA